MLSGMEAGRCHLRALPLPCSSSPVTPEKECIPSSGTPILPAEAHGTNLGCLVLVTNGACTSGSHGSPTKGERFLKQLPPPEHKRQQTKVPSLSVKEAYYLIFKAVA